MIPTSYTYLLVDFFCIIFPLLFSFHPKFKFITEFRFFWRSCLLVTLIFVTWDMIFTAMGIWSFNPRYVCGLFIYNMPIEEILFFICIPYACQFTYYCCKKYLLPKPDGKYFYFITSVFAGLLLLISAIYYTRLYTSVTFFLLGITLLILAYKKARYLKLFFISYLLILLPFFISNGVLTGSFTDEPVVIYNDHHNLGIRLFTIPLEDAFYGMLLLLLNTVFYEYFKNKTLSKEN